MPKFTHKILLSSGVHHPLEDVSDSLTVLNLLLGDETSRHLVYDLRQLCLGQDIPADRRKSLRQQDLLATNGDVEPTMKDVVLASVRGEGQALHLVSPFTNSLDRSLSEFLSARHQIWTELPKEEARRLLAEEDPLPKAAQLLVEESKQQGGNWAVRRNKPGSQSPGPTEPSR